MRRTKITTAIVAATLAWCPVISFAATPKGKPGQGIIELANKGDRYMLLRKNFDADFAAAKASKKTSVEQWTRLVRIAAGIPDRQSQCREAINLLVKKQPEQAVVLDLADQLANNGNKTQAAYLLDTYFQQSYDALLAKADTQLDEVFVSDILALSDYLNRYNCTTVSKMNDLMAHVAELLDNQSPAEAELEADPDAETITENEAESEIKPEAETISETEPVLEPSPETVIAPED